MASSSSCPKQPANNTSQGCQSSCPPQQTMVHNSLISKLLVIRLFQTWGWIWFSVAVAQPQYRLSLGQGATLHHGWWVVCSQNSRKQMMWHRQQMLSRVEGIMGIKRGSLQQQWSLFPSLSEKPARDSSQQPSSHSLPLCSFSFPQPSTRPNISFVGKPAWVLLLFLRCLGLGWISLWKDRWK